MGRWFIGFITDYQVWATFFAAILGFTGIIVTLVVQRNFDRALEREKFEAQRSGLISAMTVELIGVREYARASLDHLTDRDTFLHPRKLPFFIFDELAQKIDLLTSLEVQSIRHCYAWLREIPARAVLLQPPEAKVAEGYVLIPSGVLHVVRSWYEELDRTATAALADLGWFDP